MFSYNIDRHKTTCEHIILGDVSIQSTSANTNEMIGVWMNMTAIRFYTISTYIIDLKMMQHNINYLLCFR